MSKETKADGVVRGIFDQVTEHIHELKGLDANMQAKEVDVERWCQSFLKNCLGYPLETNESSVNSSLEIVSIVGNIG